LSDALIVFSPSGKRGRFPLGTPVLQAARELGVDIDSICGGRARCGRCQVEAVETAIWLTEVAPKHPKVKTKFWDHLKGANEQANPDLLRIALKLLPGPLARFVGESTVVDDVEEPGGQEDADCSDLLPLAEGSRTDQVFRQVFHVSPPC
jgi:hypothetical protein